MGFFLHAALASLLFSSTVSAQGFVLDADPLVAGQPATITITGATPGGLVRIGYSTAGGGPIQSPYGPVLLSRPISEQPPEIASYSGSVISTVLIPPNVAGVTVWIQALDVPTGTLSNGVHDTVSVNQPDLEPISFSTSSCEVPYLGDIQVTWSVVNSGAPQSSSFEIGFYLSLDSVIDPITDIQVGTVIWPSLASGVTAGSSNSFSIPAGTGAGTYTLGMMVDPLNLVAEGSEVNNILVTGSCGGTIFLTDYIDLEADKCATIGSALPSQNGHPLLTGGSYDYIGLGDDSNAWTTGFAWGELRSLLQWDVSSSALHGAGLPPGIPILSVEMLLPLSQYSSSLSGEVARVGPLTSSWSEYQVSWNTRPQPDPIIHDNAIFTNSGGNLRINVDWTFSEWQQNSNFGCEIKIVTPPTNGCALIKSVHSSSTRPILRLFF